MWYYIHMKIITYYDFFYDKNFTYISKKVYDLLQSHTIQPVILAGGKNSRMNEPKALLTLGDLPLLTRIAQGMEDFFGRQPFIVTNTPEVFASFDYPLYGDLHPYHGPLSGLETALHYSKCPYIYVTPCDAAFFSVPLALQLCEALADSMKRDSRTPSEAFLPRHSLPDGRVVVEPLYGLYHTASQSAIQASLQAQTYAVRSALDHMAYTSISIKECEHTFLNINTREDLQFARQLFATKTK